MRDDLEGIGKIAFVAQSGHSSDICLERLSQESRWPRPRSYPGYPECEYVDRYAAPVWLLRCVRYPCYSQCPVVSLWILR